MKQTKKKKPYVISLTLGDVTHTGEGDTLLEALESIKKPVKIISKGKFTVTNGEKSLERTLMPVKIKRLFMPITQFYQARAFSLLLK
jgi:hypothetical protein